MATDTTDIPCSDQLILCWARHICDGIPVKSGHFLQLLAEAILQADSENFTLLKPVLSAFVYKYPKYLDGPLDDAQMKLDFPLVEG